MKKYLLVAAFVLTISILQAQSNSIGITAGSTVANMRSKVDGESVTIDSKIGFSAGIVADLSFAKNLRFQPMLNFTQKGAKEKTAFDGDKETISMTLNYLELPLNILYKLPSGKNSIFIGGGPSLSMGIGGKGKYTSSAYPEDNTKSTIKFGSNEDEDDFKAFDAGVNVTGGVYLKGGFMVAFNYYHGLSNLFINPSGNESLRNRYFGLRIGYMLSSKTAVTKK